MHIQLNKYKNFLRQGGFAPLQSPKSCKRAIFDRKGTWILYFWFPQILVLLWKRRATPLRPPKIIYFCKFRLKRVWNYAYLACKIQNFLRQGGAAPLQPPPGGQPPGPPWTPRASALSPRSGGGGRKQLPKFSAKFSIGLHVILQIQIKKFENDCYIMWKII